MMKALDCNGRPLDLSRPAVMGVLNATPDSFSDGGDLASVDAAVRVAVQMQADGAAILDVGGESTRPGAAPVTADEECMRVLPVIEALLRETDLPLSVDTSKPQVMRAAVAAGAGLINDVYALQRDGALAAAADCAVPVCLMHMQGDPSSMQDNPQYGDVVAEVRGFLNDRVAAATGAGISKDSLLLDPGFGFGKTVQQNLALIARLPELRDLGLPLLVGVSRKSTIGAVLDDRPVQQRLAGGLGLAAIAVWQGARLIRSHDVRETVDAIRMVTAVQATH